MSFVLCLLAANAAIGQERLSTASHQHAPILLIHDAGPNPGPDERQAISWMRDLLGHFGRQVMMEEVQSYLPGSIEAHSATIYLGLRPGVELPEAFLADCEKAKRLCWIGENISQLVLRATTKRYGFTVSPVAPETRPAKVAYKATSYWRDNTPLPLITIVSPGLCHPVAVVEAGDRRDRPYAVQTGGLWYFAELPLHPAHAPGAHLVLCDQIHEILDEPHDIARTALLYIAGVTPETDPGKLDALTRQIQGIGIPFAVEVAAIALETDSGRQVILSRKRVLVSVLRGAQRTGATIIGVPESAASSSFERTLSELARCGLYPLAWSIERGAWSATRAAEASQFASFGSTVLDRRTSDTDSANAPSMPFLVALDSSGQRVMPDNLPRLRQGRGEVEKILEAASRQAEVPDPWVTVGIAPTAPAAAVSLLVDGLRANDYGFHDLRFVANSTSGKSLHIRTVRTERKLAYLLPQDWGAMVLGPEAGARREFDRPTRKQLAHTTVPPGAIFVSYPPGRRPKVIFSIEGDVQQVMQRGVNRVAQLTVIFALTAVGALFLVYLVQLLQRRGA